MQHSRNGARQPVFRSIDHVGIAVHDLDAAMAWYVEKFGMRVIHTEVNEDQGVREAMLAVGDNGPRLQLLAPLHDDSPIAKFLQTRGEGLNQLAYAVDDVEAAAETLRARGMEPLYDKARRGTGGSLVNFVHPKDAGGVLVELVEEADPGDDPSYDQGHDQGRDQAERDTSQARRRGGRGADVGER